MFRPRDIFARHSDGGGGGNHLLRRANCANTTTDACIISVIFFLFLPRSNLSVRWLVLCMLCFSYPVRWHGIALLSNLLRCIGACNFVFILKKK